MKDDLSKIKEIVVGAQKPIMKRLDKIEKKLDTTISYFDTVTTDHGKRIKRVEKHLNLPSLAD